MRVSCPAFLHFMIRLSGLLALPLLAFAADPATGGTDADELARKATDPTASLKAYTFLLTQTNGFHGASSTQPDDQTVVKFQPAIPFAAFGHPNMLRLTMPYQLGGRGEEGFSSLSVFDVVILPQSWGRFAVGPVMTLDLTGDAPDRFVLGPALGGVMPLSKKLSVGLFSQNVFGGNTAVSSLQPIITYQLGGGWSLSGGDLQFTYDWKSGRWVNAPIGLQFGKVMKLGKLPVRVAVNPQYNLISTPGLPRGSVTFSFTALFP